LTGAVIGTGAGADVDNAWEQRKLEARKLLENAAESPASSARFVSPLFDLEGKIIFLDATPMWVIILSFLCICH